jgi:CubicO group peptidase (beta-lactamase class C family)
MSGRVSLVAGRDKSAVEDVHSFDLVIRGGRVCRVGEPSTIVDVGVRNGRITSIGRIEASQARDVIDAHDSVIAPGRVAISNRSLKTCVHTGWSWQQWLEQGVTTVIFGDDELPPQPHANSTLEMERSSMSEDLQLLSQIGPEVNVVPMIGLNSIRRSAIENDQHSQTCNNLRALQNRVEEGMKAGAFGIVIAVNDVSDHDIPAKEVVSLAQVARRFGGLCFLQQHSAGKVPQAQKVEAQLHRVGGIEAELLDDSLVDYASDSASIGSRIRHLLHDRGIIEVGMAADLTIAEDRGEEEHSSCDSPQKSSAIRTVLVNGKVAYCDGKTTSAHAGSILRGPAFKTPIADTLPMTGFADASFGVVDSLVKDYLASHHLPGCSVAITDHGRLVYARGFGVADVDTREPVNPNSLFRIASLSKPITAAGILQLIDSGQIDLDTPVASILKRYLPDSTSPSSYDPRLDDVTIRELLQHRGGWDREVSFDPMFAQRRFTDPFDSQLPTGRDEIIRGMFGRQLDFNPGERYTYSNFGYCLLGRVIESVSGLTYEEYVRKHVLQPLGLEHMAIGSTLLSQRRSNEVRYYDPYFEPSVFADTLNQRVAAPYGAWSIELMDSHGGWLASAIDLVKFASAFDEPDHCVLLKPATVRSISERPPGLAGFDEQGNPRLVYYGLGWQVHCDHTGRIVRQMHAGSLPGTSTLLVRNSDGRDVAVLFNARETPFTSEPAKDIFPDLIQAIENIHKWPQVDYFDICR